MRITDAMARTMKLPPSVRIARDIADQGNTSAASIPLALERMIADGEARSGDIALLIARARSEEHPSELQSLMRIPYAVFCLNKQHTSTVQSQTHRPHSIA